MSVRPELTLAAALRDVRSANVANRERALQCLASALLAESGETGPSWDAATRHDRGNEVVAALMDAIDREPVPELRGAAWASLGQLGVVDAWSTACSRIDGPAHRPQGAPAAADESRSVYERECAVIYLSFVGVAARQAGEIEVCEQARRQLEAALQSSFEAVRFQAALGLAEVGGDQVESVLLAALQHETHPRVRAQFVEALSLGTQTLSVTAIEALERVMSEDEGNAVQHAAAMALAAARQPAAVGRLVASLDALEYRDDAIEALAVFSTDVAHEAIDPIRRLARGWRTPGTTRVRAAYALARWMPAEGQRILTWMRFHPLAGVRAAVHDATQLLRKTT